MSTNFRKAQKHMQRATELLNQEGQLGFGGPDGVATKKRKREEIEQAQGSQEPIQCGICLENITPEDGSPLHACHPKYEDIKDTKEHWFHSECLRPWINAGNPCPLCKNACHLQLRVGAKSATLATRSGKARGKVTRTGTGKAVSGRPRAKGRSVIRP